LSDRFFEETLAELGRRQLLREPDDGSCRTATASAAAALGTELLDASSNDYLGLAALAVSRETLSAWPGVSAGSGASRLIHGTRDAHLELEQELASWVRLPAALLFSSGYAANAGLLAALTTSGAVVLSDVLNHASLIDGCRLGRATVRVLPHLDLEQLERELRRVSGRTTWVVTESYFSMDGDGPDLRKLRALCDEHGAGLVVDEAHALGVFGPEGAGRCAEAGVTPDILVGTLGKSVGAHGAFVAGSTSLRRFLWNRARSFVFSTAPSPALAKLAVLHVKQVRAADSLRAQLSARSLELREALRAKRFDVPESSFGPIVPVILGGNALVQRAASGLSEQGILVQGIRPPTVPVGTARLRLTVTASMTASDVTRLVEALERMPRESEPALSAVARTPIRRIVVLGTGTEVGKTHVAALLVKALRRRGCSLVALKPVESGSVTVVGPDASVLAIAAGHPPPGGGWTFPDALSPHLAARRAGRSITSAAVRRWVDSTAKLEEAGDGLALIESAGGVFSPLSETETNLDFAAALEPAFWVLVAHNSLGVLHDVTATLSAMGARGRRPDALVLSAARPVDVSSDSNALELARLGVATPVAVVGKNDDESALDQLVDRVLAS
jgi:8-amino-7-oxononanoate synthase